MSNKFKSLLEEIVDYSPSKPKEKDLIIESRAVQIIGSANNLVKLIKENYTPDEADDLIKRLLRSIQTGEEAKFTRKINSIRENRLNESESSR